MSFLEGFQTTPSFQTLHTEATFEKLDDDAIRKRLENEAPKLKKYLDLNESVFNLHSKKVYNIEALAHVTELLEWNPELYSIWNYRRDLLTNLQLLTHASLKKELMFVLLKLKQFPKSYWIWNHRIWCLQKDPVPDWQMELQLIQKFFEADSRNYHAWQYRRVIVELMKGDDWAEWNFTRNMINKDISNYSAWHNRSKLVEKLFKFPPNHDDDDPYIKIFATGDKHEFIVREWQLVKTAIYTDADDSSVWFYIKWLLGDYFLRDSATHKIYTLLTDIHDQIQELNELEMEDNEIENKWCVSAKLHILNQFIKFGITSSLLDTKKNLLNTLKTLDPMRAKRYC